MPPRRRRRHDGDELAAQFALRRHQLQLTQSQVADLAGVSRSSVQALEGDRTGLRLSIMAAIADALGCDLVLHPRGTIRG